MRAPFVAGLAVSLADPSGPIEAAGVGGDGEVRHEPFQSGATSDRGGPRHPGGGPEKRNPLKGYRPSLEGTAPEGEQVLVERAPSRRLLRLRRPPRRRRRSASGWSPRRKPPPTPPRRAVSWGSARRRSARARRRCWTRCAPRSHRLDRARRQVDLLDAHIGN